ncbi:MAG TPA: hypothetical protein VFQ93_15905 [Casimicrobiaceae bacterium]|jgi:hypothetical protein|nr:hypothetical protein [Casimicrobiaceae bacterium]
MDRQQQQGYGQQHRRSQQQGTDRGNEPQQRQQGESQSRQYGGSQPGGSRAFGGRQQSQESAGSHAFGAQQLQSMAEVALRGTALLFDLQMETARNIMRTQARTAALLGAPDYSELFRLGDDRARRLFAASAEQMLTSARQARETVFEVQRQIGRLAEQQTIGIAEEMREQIQQMTRHTEAGLQEIKQVAASEADYAQDFMHDAMHDEQRPQRLEREMGTSNEAEQDEPAQGVEHVAHNGQRAANEAQDVEADPNVESNLKDNPRREARERERGRARR